MTISSRQRRLLSEEQPTGAPPPGNAQGNAGEAPPAQPAPQKAPQAPQAPENAGEGTEAPVDAAKTQRAIKGIERLQDAAAAMEAGKFALQTEFSDFSSGRKLDMIKQELLKIIGKAREHLSHASATSPDSAKVVSDWLKL